MVRNSLKYVARKDYKAVTSGLKSVYPAPTEEAALMVLDVFADEWDDKYPQISKSWSAHRENLNTFFSYPPDIRKAIYINRPPYKPTCNQQTTISFFVII